MATRLPLWHRLAVLSGVLLFSAAILLWGFVLNVWTIAVETRPGDRVTVDGSDLSSDGRVRAGQRRVRVMREHFATFDTTVRVNRNETTTVAPVMAFIPYRANESRSVTTPLIPVMLHAATYHEIPGDVASYPSGPFPIPDLPSDITEVRFSPDWSMLWIAERSGDESLRDRVTGKVLWEGRTLGRAFAADRFVAVRADGSAAPRIDVRDTDGKWSTLSGLDGEGTFTLVPSPDGTTCVVISDVRGTVFIASESGRQRVSLQEAALDARWSPDGARVLFQVRLSGAGASVRLVAYDVAADTEELLDLRAPIALTSFGPEGGTIIALERQATATTDRNTVLQQLADPRAQQLVNDLDQKLISFSDFQDLLPADLQLALTLVRIDLATKERTELQISGADLTSEALQLAPGADPGTLHVLLPTSIETIVLAER